MDHEIILKQRKSYAASAAMLILFGAMFMRLLSSGISSNDFWWHIATGRYIVAERMIPEEDPFSYPAALAENRGVFPERQELILKQYWLAQVLFYIFFNWFGAEGVIWLRSVVLLLTVVVVYRMLCREPGDLPAALIFSSFVFVFIIKNTADRPVIFTALFTASLIFLLERFRERRGLSLVFLIPIMILWSNMHGGFTLGVAIILIYMTGEVVDTVIGRGRYTGKEQILFYGATICAVLLTIMNPAGWKAFLITFSPKYNIFYQGIQEWESPVSSYLEGVRQIEYEYIVLIMLFPIFLALRNRKIDISHFILFSVLLYMALTAERFVIYFAIAASMIIGREVSVFTQNIYRKLFPDAWKVQGQYLIVIITSFFLVYMVIHYYRSSGGWFMARPSYMPESAVDFIEAQGLQGNMFNEYTYGGYLAWRLYPRQKTFIDSRSLNYYVSKEFGFITDAKDLVEGKGSEEATAPFWERLLSHYHVNYILFKTYDVYGQVPKLIFKLLEHPSWTPVFCDGKSIIVVRNSEKNQGVIAKYRILPDTIYNMMIVRLSQYSLAVKPNHLALFSLAQIFERLGRTDDAARAYNLAISQMQGRAITGKEVGQPEIQKPGTDPARDIR